MAVAVAVAVAVAGSVEVVVSYIILLDPVEVVVALAESPVESLEAAAAGLASPS